MLDECQDKERQPEDNEEDKKYHACKAASTSSSHVSKTPRVDSLGGFSCIAIEEAAASVHQGKP